MRATLAGMELREHIEILRTDGMLLANAAEATGLDPVVPTTPEWTVRDLLRHVGEVHRWAESHVARALQIVNVENFALYPEDDALLVPWFRQGHAQLLQTLENADPDLDCVSFLPGPVKGTHFWARRQAHETAIHRVDAQSVTGLISESEPAFAADGIDELLYGFFARRPSKRLVSPEPVSFALSARDVGRTWLVRIDEQGASATDGDGEAQCRVEGTAFDLYLLLWNRRTLDVQGDPRALRLWRDKARVSWS